LRDEIAREVLEKDGLPEGYTICSTETVKADADACYRAFANTAELDRWLGPGSRSTSTRLNGCRVGSDEQPQDATATALRRFHR